jgi:hypothetical protein
MSGLRLALGSVNRECSKSGCGVPKVDDKEGGLHTEADFGHSNSCSVPVALQLAERITYL